MMSDIRGFTTLSEHLAPAQVVTMLNRYLGAMTDIIMAHNGTIDEFIGDAILPSSARPSAVTTMPTAPSVRPGNAGRDGRRSTAKMPPRACPRSDRHCPQYRRGHCRQYRL